MIGKAYWIAYSRTFIPVIEGRKHITGLVIEADGFHVHKEPSEARLQPVWWRANPKTIRQEYPRRKLLAFIRKRRGATATAEKLRKRVIEELRA